MRGDGIKVQTAQKTRAVKAVSRRAVAGRKPPDQPRQDIRRTAEYVPMDTPVPDAAARNIA